MGWTTGLQPFVLRTTSGPAVEGFVRSRAEGERTVELPTEGSSSKLSFRYRSVVEREKEKDRRYPLVS